MDMSYFVDESRPYTVGDFDAREVPAASERSRINDVLFELASAENAIAIIAHLNARDKSRAIVELPDYCKGQSEIYEKIRERNDQKKGWRKCWTIVDYEGDGEDSEAAQEKPIDLWRRKALIVRRLCGVCLTLRKYAVEAGLINNFVVSVSSRRVCVQGEDEEESEELEWDLDNFRANREIRVPRATVEILEKLPLLRTSHDIQVIASLMRSLPSFRKYTTEMQLMMCRIVRYMRCSSRRVVLRKGHLGFSVYFIVTGSVSVVMDRDDQSVFVKPEVVILRKGACFGEIALLQNTRRNATIVCADECEFLVIDKEDFIQNGLNERLDEEFAFRYNFYRNWEPIQSWPDDAVKTLAYCSRTEDYNYNKIIASGAIKNEFLWFVVKGSCDILKLVNMTNMREYETLQTLPSGVQRFFASPRGMKNNNENKKRAQSAPLKKKMAGDRRVKSAHLASHKDRSDPNSGMDMSSEHSRSTSRSSISRGLDTIESDSVNSSMDLKLIPPIVKNTRKNKAVSDNGDQPSGGVYVQMDQLRDGQCFGLEQLFSSETTNTQLSMVSKGCVIIHVPRRQFEKLADKTSLRKINNLVKEYPKDMDLIDSFCKKRIWDNYKQNIIEEVVIDRLSNKPKAGLRSDKLEQYMKHKDNIGDVSYGTMLNVDQTAKTRLRLQNAIESLSGRTNESTNNSNCRIPRRTHRYEISTSPVGRTKYSYESRPNTSYHPNRLSSPPPPNYSVREKRSQLPANHLKSKSTIITGRYEGASMRMSAKLRQLKSQSLVLPSSHAKKHNECVDGHRGVHNEKLMPHRTKNNINSNTSLFQSKSSVWPED